MLPWEGGENSQQVEFEGEGGSGGSCRPQSSPEAELWGRNLHPRPPLENRDIKAFSAQGLWRQLLHLELVRECWGARKAEGTRGFHSADSRV